MSEQQAERSMRVGHAIDVYVTIVMISLLGYLALGFIAPFVTILLWAAILAVALMPVFDKLREWVGGRSGLASALLAVLGLVILLVPSIMIVQSIIDSLGGLADLLSRDVIEVPAPSEKIKEWPLIGERLHALWTAAHDDFVATLGRYSEQLKSAGVVALSAGGGLMLSIVQFAFSIIFAALFLANAPIVGDKTRRFASRIGNERGLALVEMAQSTVRNVSRGVIGVAMIQGGLAAIGYFVADIPFAGPIAVLTLGASIVSVPPLVIIPTIIWAWSAMATPGALLFTVYMLAVMMSDNFLKPVLMARGLRTPMIVILIGVIGGTLSAGLLGLFVGPVVLALVYELILNWVATSPEPATAGGSDKAAASGENGTTASPGAQAASGMANKPAAPGKPAAKSGRGAGKGRRRH